MKKLLLILLCLPMIGFGQDVLLFQDGNKKDVTILEITPIIVKYKKFNSSNKVIYTEDKNNLIGVIFEDGEFEKFENNIKSFTKSNDLNQLVYGNNMFYLSPITPIFGVIQIGYEHYSSSGKSSMRIPLVIQIIGQEFFSAGYEYKFFPTGSSGGVKGFLGFGEAIGSITITNLGYDYYSGYYNYNSTYFLNETKFIAGVQFHPSKLINITLDAGIGLGLLDFYETYLSYQIGINLGFRF